MHAAAHEYKEGARGPSKEQAIRAQTHDLVQYSVETPLGGHVQARVELDVGRGSSKTSRFKG
eukprot:3051296-Prorocentrum_lima.AAC.1